jgi:tRNA (guanine37-N1)-methyltransferase
VKFHVITLFPEVIDSYAQASILGRAQTEKLLTVKTYHLRDFVTNKWGKADARPYGGGPGMVIQAEPVIAAVESIAKKINRGKTTTIYRSASKPKIIITSPNGKLLTNAYAKKLTNEKNVVIVCGRYEGIDSRVNKILKARGMSVEEVSTGSYILTGGEVPALAIIDATARQIKGVLGKFESLEEGRVASHEVYTRPEVLKYKNPDGVNKNYKVPKILLSGHRAKIDEWKSKKKHTSRGA